jgi:hypothetical protein
MAAIEMLIDARGGFKCGFDGWPQTLAEKREWQSLISYMVRYAYLERAAALVTADPAKWSLANSLSEGHTSATKIGRYLVTKIERCSAALIEEIVESEDFQRGLLWMTSTDDGDAHLWAELSFDERGLPLVPGKAEVLALLDDARRVHWIHPGLNVATLEREIRRRIAILGWSMRASSAEE